MVVLLPVFVLAEGAAVASGVAAATRLAGFPPTVPAALVRQWGERGLIKISLFFVREKSHFYNLVYLSDPHFSVFYSFHGDLICPTPLVCVTSRWWSTAL